MNEASIIDGERALEAATADDLRLAMRRLPSGVAVVALNGPDGLVGMAATSITSLSMSPPSILVCVNRSAAIHPFLAPGTWLGINLLSRDQCDVSRAFGGAVEREARFAVGNWTSGPHQTPLLAHAEANLACIIDTIIAYGTHSIVIARVDQVRLREEAKPMIYLDGAYL